MAQLLLVSPMQPKTPHSWQIIRISALLLAIFALGIVIGRWSATVPNPASTTASSDLDALAKQPGDMLTERYSLDQERERNVREIIDRMANQMRPFEDLPPAERVRKRRDIWRSYLPAFREVIPAQHRDDFEDRIAAMDRRLKRVIWRRERQSEEEQR